MAGVQLIRIFGVALLCAAGFMPAAQTTSGVSTVVNKKTGLLEIRNGMLGVVIPWEAASAVNKFNLAPLQSFIYPDGSYSDNTPNIIRSASSPVAMKTTFLKNNSDEVTARIEYRFNKEKFSYGKENYRGSEAGPGFYTVKITVKKGEKTVIIEEDANYDIEYSIKISNGLRPDKARYRGWQASSPKDGYEPGGGVYRAENARGYGLDATVDLDYAKEFTYPRLSLWEPEGGEINSGRYWQLFNAGAANQSNLFGFFHGEPKRLIGAHHIGPALRISPTDAANGEKNIAEVVVSISRRAPDNLWHPRKRFQWVAFLATKTDLVDPAKVQPIGVALNRIAGIATTVQTYATKPAKLVPGFYSMAIYMPAEQMEALRQKIKADKEFYQRLCTQEAGYKQIWDAWRIKDSARSLLNQLLQLKKNLVSEYTSGDGVYKGRQRYWAGVMNYKFYALSAAALFSDKSISLSENERKELELLVALLARILWDDNNVPFFDSAGVNFGPTNMAYQYRNNGRVFFALLMANDPEFSERARNALAEATKDVKDAIDENGTAFGSPHYIQPTIDPVLFTLLQLKQSGVADLFKTLPRLRQFGQFYLSLVTPPSPRFSSNRKVISFGDGSEESSSTFALLSTGLKSIDVDLSKQLLSVYFNGPARFSYAGPVALAADISEPQQSLLSIKSANYPGYLAHIRSAINKKEESSLWVLNGERYSDHRNDDAGEVAIYALSAPLSLSRSSFYYPPATDARIRSVVIPEKQFPEWNANTQPISERSLTNRTWPSSQNHEFADLGYATLSSSVMKNKDGNTWVRTISAVTLNDDLPVYIFNDSVTGPGNQIWSMLFMSQGSVNTPAGNISPNKKIHDNGSAKELPAASQVNTLKAGWNRFAFTGQAWKRHYAGGIDWILYGYFPRPAAFTLAQWGTTWQNNIEREEFAKTNGREYVEEQQILRLQQANPFFMVLLPYAKGKESYSNNIQPTGNGLKVTQRNYEIMISNAGWKANNENEGIIVLLDGRRKVEHLGYALEGGICGIQYNRAAFSVRVHGNTGRRTITVPHKKVLLQENRLGVSVRTNGGNTTITIDYINKSSSDSPAENLYTEYTFRVSE